MSTAPESATPPAAPTPPASKPIINPVTIVIALAVAAGAYFAIPYFIEKNNPPETAKVSFAGAILDETFAAGLEDKNGDGLADPPATRAELMKDKDGKIEIVLTVLDPLDQYEIAKDKDGKPMYEKRKEGDKEVDDDEKPIYAKDEKGNLKVAKPGAQSTWAPFIEDAAAKGLKITIKRSDYTDPKDVEDLKSGKIGLAMLSTGLTTKMVYKAGVHPLATLGKEGKYGYNVVMIVPSDSNISKPEDVKGQRVAFASFSSHSGFKAPVVHLFEKHKLLVTRDYDFDWPGDQRAAIKGVAEKKYPIAFAASDLVARSEYKDKLKVIPVAEDPIIPITLCASSALPDDVRKTIDELIKDYKFKGAMLERYKDSNQTEFVPITNFKEQFKPVLETGKALNKILTENGLASTEKKT